MKTIHAISLGLQKRFGRKNLRTWLLGSTPFLVLLSLWQANSSFGWLSPVYIPEISEVIEAVFTLQEECPGVVEALALDRSCILTNHLFNSIGRVLLAALIGLPLGIAFGIMAGLNRHLSKILEPIAIFSNSISGIAWVPLAIVWFGVGWVTTLFIMLNTIVWLMFFNTMLGVRSVPRVLVQSVRTLGGNQWHVISQVYFPGAMPSIITGMRMSLGFGWRALIAAEMIGGDSGLGFMIFIAADEFKIEEIFLGVIIISMIWMMTDHFLLSPLEKWTIERWGLVWKLK